jgi:hypothetical protein
MNFRFASPARLVRADDPHDAATVIIVGGGIGDTGIDRR